MLALQQKIDELWDFNDPAASIIRFRQAAHDSEHVWERAEYTTQVARAQGLQRQFEDAHHILDQVERTLAPHGSAAPGAVDPFAAARVRLLLERGRVFNSCQQPDKSLPLFEQAHRLAHAIHHDHLAVDAAHMIAIAHTSAGHHDRALDWNRKAIRFAERSDQPRARQWLASLHNNLGWILHVQGDFTAALHHFEQALAARRQHGPAQDIRIARWCVARCLRSLGRIDEALQMQREINAELDSTGEARDGFVHEEIAECLLLLGQPAQARPHFALAHQLLSTDAALSTTEPERIERLKLLAHSA